MSGIERVPEAAQDDAIGRGRAQRLTWLCAAVSAIAAVVMLLLFGITLWTLAGLVLLVACPVVVGAVLLDERDYKSATSRRASGRKPGTIPPKTAESLFGKSWMSGSS